MRLTRRSFIMGCIGLGGRLVLPERFLSAAGVPDDRWSPAYKISEDRGLLAQKVEEAGCCG